MVSRLHLVLVCDLRLLGGLIQQPLAKQLRGSAVVLGGMIVMFGRAAVVLIRLVIWHGQTLLEPKWGQRKHSQYREVLQGLELIQKSAPGGVPRRQDKRHIPSWDELI